MTIDVNVRRTSEAFYEELEEIMEDTMVQMFILHPADAEELEAAKEEAREQSAIFYAAPLSLIGAADEHCVAYTLSQHDAPERIAEAGKALFVDAALLTPALTQTLGRARGVILNPRSAHAELPDFCLAIGPGTLESFDEKLLGSLDMDRIVLQSGYPEFGFEEIYPAVKKISDALCRPEQSIIARATKRSLELFGFRNG